MRTRRLYQLVWIESEADLCYRSYDIPVVKDSVNYADALLKSYSLSAAAYSTAEALATTVYKRAGEPLQDKLQPQASVLSTLKGERVLTSFCEIWTDQSA